MRDTAERIPMPPSARRRILAAKRINFIGLKTKGALPGFREEDTISDLCRREVLAETMLWDRFLEKA